MDSTGGCNTQSFRQFFGGFVNCKVWRGPSQKAIRVLIADSLPWAVRIKKYTCTSAAIEKFLWLAISAAVPCHDRSSFAGSLLTWFISADTTLAVSLRATLTSIA